MNGPEYREIIERLGLTQVGAARFLGVSDTTSRRWIADSHKIPQSVEMLLRIMVKKRLPPHVITKLTT